MESQKAGLSRAGQAIRAALDGEAGADEQRRAARAGLLDRIAARNSAGARAGWLARRGAASRPRRRIALLGAAGVLVAAGVVGLWMRLPVTFQITAAAKGAGADVSGRLGDVVEVIGAEPVTLRFSEGSAVALRTGGRVRVLSAEPTGARVLLENGALDVAIVHRRVRATRWTFEAGPFHVQVTGTRFHVAWHPSEQSFALDADEGSVLVSGGCMKAPRAVGAGDAFQISCQAPAPPRTPSAPPRPSPQGSNAPPEEPAGAGAARGAGNWRGLLAAGRLADGLRAAERGDFARVCRVASQKELVTLGDAARLSGHTVHAVEALTILRQRFAGSPDAATAAFALGRVAFERRAAYAEAVRWFGTYLAELPEGPLMGDAVGRLMEARQRASDRAGARADAERYLRRFPDGPYAPEARAMLSE